MKNLFIFTIAVTLSFAACQQSTSNKTPDSKPMYNLDIQGHRGARGLMPENTIPAFKKALDLRVTTLELDLSVTGDGHLIVSHEPWISAEICQDKSGNTISEESKSQLNVFQMTYNEVRSYDCGSKVNERFPEQQKISVGKPLLENMIKEAEAYGEGIGYTNFGYNIEIKSMPQGDELYHPVPSEFSDLVYSTLDSLLAWDRVTIQSFDFRVLKYFNRTYPDVSLVALIENDNSWEENIKELGFNPEIYSPYYKLLSKRTVTEIQQEGIKVIPWTVNTAGEMNELIDWGVSGIITDYPNIAVNLMKK